MCMNLPGTTPDFVANEQQKHQAACVSVSRVKVFAIRYQKSYISNLTIYKLSLF